MSRRYHVVVAGISDGIPRTVKDARRVCRQIRKGNDLLPEGEIQVVPAD